MSHARARTRLRFELGVDPIRLFDSRSLQMIQASWEAVGVLLGLMALLLGGATAWVHALIDRTALQTQLDIATMRAELIRKLTEDYVCRQQFESGFREVSRQLSQLRSPELADQMQTLIGAIEERLPSRWDGRERRRSSQDG